MKLVFPEKALDQHGVVLGKTGAGKSSALRHIVEHLLDQKKRVCIIDPKGDWWGLKASADGKDAGYPVIAFGDYKNEEASDVPINAQSGKHVAELISTGNRPAIIGFRGWMTSHMVQFWIDFASGVFRENQGELYLFIDEVHNFAPKGKIMDPQAGKCLHWTNRLMSEGRGLGLVAWIASQRPQKVHNDTLTSCETLVAMRVIHAADRGAVEDWIKGAGDKVLGQKVLNNIASLARGEAFVWSPEIGYGPELIAFPMFKTFDSFAPPQLQKKVNQRSWADVNLDEVKEKLAAVIEEAKSNDPKELRKELAQVRMELNRALEAKPEPKPKLVTKEVPVIKEGQIERLEKVEHSLKGLWGEIEDALNKVIETGTHPLQKFQPVKNLSAVSPDAPVRVAPSASPSRTQKVEHRATSSGGGHHSNGNLAPRHQDIINAIAFYNSIGVQQCDKKQIAGFVTRPFNGNFRSDLAVLRTAGLIDYPSPAMVALTDSGLRSVTELPNIRTQSQLHQLWLNKLPPRHAQILKVLLDRPGEYDKRTIATTVGREFNGNFRSDLSVLRTLGTIDYPSPGSVTASENLFPPLPP